MPAIHKRVDGSGANKLTVGAPRLPTITINKELIMPMTTPGQNKALVLEAFDTLFNKRDYTAAERFWPPKYSQHSAHIAPGRDPQ